MSHTKCGSYLAAIYLCLFANSCVINSNVPPVITAVIHKVERLWVPTMGLCSCMLFPFCALYIILCFCLPGCTQVSPFQKPCLARWETIFGDQITEVTQPCLSNYNKWWTTKWNYSIRSVVEVELGVERCQLSWLRHLVRMCPGYLPVDVFWGCPTSRRPPGRPRTAAEGLCLPAGWGTPRGVPGRAGRGDRGGRRIQLPPPSFRVADEEINLFPDIDFINVP